MLCVLPIATRRLLCSQYYFLLTVKKLPLLLIRWLFQHLNQELARRPSRRIARRNKHAVVELPVYSNIDIKYNIVELVSNDESAGVDAVNDEVFP